mmetsp:Transcript_22855/g.48963  ORF Transcript_22855/g.48963 Transcript_22855/m.48963 type:complete len:201 (-) Transcript_22855:450-1052(-)
MCRTRVLGRGACRTRRTARARFPAKRGLGRGPRATKGLGEASALPRMWDPARGAWIARAWVLSARATTRDSASLIIMTARGVGKAMATARAVRLARVVTITKEGPTVGRMVARIRCMAKGPRVRRARGLLEKGGQERVARGPQAGRAPSLGCPGARGLRWHRSVQDSPRRRQLLSIRRRTRRLRPSLLARWSPHRTARPR